MRTSVTVTVSDTEPGLSVRFTLRRCCTSRWTFSWVVVCNPLALAETVELPVLMGENV